MNSGVGRIVGSVGGAWGRGAVRAFPCAMSNSVYIFNASGRVVIQRLIEDVMSLCPAEVHPAVIPQHRRSINGRN